LAISLAIAAAQSGRRVYYGTLADLITSLEEAHFGCASKIFGVNDAARRPIPDVLRALAEILQKLPIDGFDFAGRRHPNNKTGNAVHDRTRSVLARTQFRVRQPTVLDVSARPVPPGLGAFGKFCGSLRALRSELVGNLLLVAQELRLLKRGLALS
jgi:hypothetical protein